MIGKKMRMGHKSFMMQSSQPSNWI